MSLIRREDPFFGDLWDWDLGMNNIWRRLNNLERSLFPDVGRGTLDKEIESVVRTNVDLKETPDKFQIVAECPGLDKKDVKIDLDEDNRILTLSGEHKKEKEEKDEKYHYRERTYGSFKRSFKLPENVKLDQVKASMHNGLLSIDIPKTETTQQQEQQRRVRSITVGDQTSNA
jgi:HSP20 family protein